MFRKHEKKSEDTSSKLAPLDEIRQAEARVATQILVARQEAEEARQTAKSKGMQMKEQAQLAGSQAGQAQCEVQIQEAVREAERMTAEAHAQAEAITHREQQGVHEAAQWAVNVVLGLEREERIL